MMDFLADNPMHACGRWLMAMPGLCLALMSTPALAVTLHLTTEEMPPKVMLNNGKITGYGADRVREMMRRAGVGFTMEVLPWSRAYSIALNTPNSCVFSAGRTAAREKLFKWVGPTVLTDYTFYAKADRHLQLRQLDDARKLRIGSYIGDVRGEFLTQRGFIVDFGPNDKYNPRKLMLGRIDLWATNTKLATVMLKELHLQQQIVPVYTFNKVGLYLACNLSLPAELIAKLNQAMAAMVEDGTFDQLEQRYNAAGAL